MPGSAEIWTRITGFRVQSANHYTTEPLQVKRSLLEYAPGPSLHKQAKMVVDEVEPESGTSASRQQPG